MSRTICVKKWLMSILVKPKFVSSRILFPFNKNQKWEHEDELKNLSKKHDMPYLMGLSKKLWWPARMFLRSFVWRATLNQRWVLPTGTVTIPRNFWAMTSSFFQIMVSRVNPNRLNPSFKNVGTFLNTHHFEISLCPRRISYKWFQSN